MERRRRRAHLQYNRRTDDKGNRERYREVLSLSKEPNGHSNRGAGDDVAPL